MRFFLGTHETHWMRHMAIPLFISRRRLMRLGRLPQAAGPWALDSGGFTEVTQFGRWMTDTEEYIEDVLRYQDEIGNLLWAAPMDWMCEPFAVEQTGLSVREHQERTVQNFLDLRGRGPFIPVLQGWTLADYEHCIDLYSQAGVALHLEPLVGLGSVCRRQATAEIQDIVEMVDMLGISAHGFGVKKEGIVRYGHMLTSADSMAWSYAGRKRPLAECSHKTCSNCRRFAELWRSDLLKEIPA